MWFLAVNLEELVWGAVINVKVLLRNAMNPGARLVTFVILG